ncbi:early light-induced protein 2, chloroplastic-like [Rutidosis leptorrhynchoides]|uniref:early light-induced protein 2, chloroplastic-like n=1 Tax=Rutidosis leptorrhynchoides TaxID=125765 RepID=UPI003A9963BB
MATSSIFTATPLPRFTTQSFLKKPTVLTVKCMSVPQEDASSDATKPSSAIPTPSPVSSTPPPPQLPRAPKVSTKFSDVLAFSGPAPERINGRLAMIGFVSALAVEIGSGQGVLTQISNGGLTVFVGTSVVLTLASLVPLFKGVSVQSKSSGLMTSDAEMWNGRAAMLGLVALAFTEFVTGSALV